MGGSYVHPSDMRYDQLDESAIAKLLLQSGEVPNATRVVQVRKRLQEINQAAMPVEAALKLALLPKRKANVSPVSEEDESTFLWTPEKFGKDLRFTVWHGTARQFTRFDNRFCGSGEGASHGYGHYVTTLSRAATRYAHYDKFTGNGNTPTVYRCALKLDRERVLNLSDPLDLIRTGQQSPLISQIGREVLKQMEFGGFNSIALELEKQLGDPNGVRKHMHEEWGVQALFDHIRGAPTFVVLDESYLTICEAWQWQKIVVDGYPLYSYELIGQAGGGASTVPVEDCFVGKRS